MPILEDRIPKDRIPKDLDHLTQLLDRTREEALRFLTDVAHRPVAQVVPTIPPLGLPNDGLGADGALDVLLERYGPWMSGSAGPRYFAFVTGGTTPAALAGDWLTSAYDQNLSDAGESGSSQLALDALGMMRELLGVSDAFQGAFVTGATTSATVAMASARQWVGRERGVDVSKEGVHALGPVRVLSGTPHSSVFKALSVTGLGRTAVRKVATLPEREAVDVTALAQALLDAEQVGEGPCVIVANAGTVNTCDFDDLDAIAALRQRFKFWLHVDGAFGTIAAASPQYRSLLDGLEHADSITVDGHKWLNVPYDGAIILTRHLDLQGAVFQSTAAYLPPEITPRTFIHLTPENSQRLRPLSTWMTLAAYGRAGYAEVVERCCDHATWLGEQLDQDPRFRLLAPVRLNGLCFALDDGTGGTREADEVAAFLDRLKASGDVFLTPTRYRDTAAARVSVTNWRTERVDMERTWDAIQRALPDD